MEENTVETEEMPEELPAQEPEVPQEPAEAAAPEFEAHILGLQQQAEAMRESWPDFDLVKELQNPVFLQLTAPGTGIGVEDKIREKIISS